MKPVCGDGRACDQTRRPAGILGGNPVPLFAGLWAWTQGITNRRRLRQAAENTFSTNPLQTILQQEIDMTRTIAKTSLVAASIFSSVLFSSYAGAQTLSEQCDLYARGQVQAAGSVQTGTRGQATASNSAASRSYQYHYDRCLKGLN